MAEIVEKTTGINYPDKGIWKKAVYFLKYHFHVVLYFYIWFGVFICGLVAPPDRVKELGSGVFTEGWHLSLLSCFVVLPWPVIYVIRFIRARRN